MPQKRSSPTDSEESNRPEKMPVSQVKIAPPRDDDDAEHSKPPLLRVQIPLDNQFESLAPLAQPDTTLESPLTAQTSLVPQSTLSNTNSNSSKLSSDIDGVYFEETVVCEPDYVLVRSPFSQSEQRPLLSEPSISSKEAEALQSPPLELQVGGSLSQPSIVGKLTPNAVNGTVLQDLWNPPAPSDLTKALASLECRQFGDEFDEERPEFFFESESVLLKEDPLFNIDSLAQQDVEKRLLSIPSSLLTRESLPNVKCTRVVEELGRLMQLHQPLTDASPLEIYEENGKIKIYYALEFCLKAMGILPDVGKECIAMYLVRKDLVYRDIAGMERDEKGSDDEGLIDIKECQRFVTRIGNLLKHSVQEGFVTGCGLRSSQKLNLYYKCECFLTGKVDFPTRAFYMPEADANSAAQRSSHPPTATKPFTLYKLSPMLLNDPEYKDFWLFASQITGMTQLAARTKILLPAMVPEEIMLLERSIALALNRFALAIVVRNEVEPSIRVTPEQYYEVVYDRQFLAGQESLKPLLEILPEGPLTKRPNPNHHTHPPDPALLDLHHLLYRLLHESKAGCAWMQESDWKEDDMKWPSSEYSSDSSVWSEVESDSEGEVKGPVVQLAEVEHIRQKPDKSAVDVWRALELKVGGFERYQELMDRGDELELDAEYTLLKAFREAKIAADSYRKGRGETTSAHLESR